MPLKLPARSDHENDGVLFVPAKACSRRQFFRTVCHRMSMKLEGRNAKKDKPSIHSD
jgi:hypothetical protein